MRLQEKTRLTVTALTTAIGAELSGIDLCRPSADDIAAISAALLAHKVVFFRDQRLDDRAQRDVAAAFGPLQRFAFAEPVDESLPEIHAIANGGAGPKIGNADIWHSDATFMQEPPMGSWLRAVQLPSCGGDTLFANMEAAYDALSSPIQRVVDELSATHDFTHSSAHRRPLHDQYPAVTHPVVRVHPVTGRRSLFVNRIFTSRINELNERENEALLTFLCDHVRSPDFQCRFTWRPGSVAFWDNRCTQHYAVADYSDARVMHRVVISGDRPRGIGARDTDFIKEATA
jgi:taurine dioxygenase